MCLSPPVVHMGDVFLDELAWREFRRCPFLSDFRLRRVFPVLARITRIELWCRTLFHTKENEG
jgi:hypothetical protein